VYLSILIVSVVLLVVYVKSKSKYAASMVIALLSVQVVYKLTTPLTVGIKNPCVISNLLIAVLHTITLGLMARNFSESFGIV
jgi:hypothetical protein